MALCSHFDNLNDTFYWVHQMALVTLWATPESPKTAPSLSPRSEPLLPARKKATKGKANASTAPKKLKKSSKIEIPLTQKSDSDDDTSSTDES